MRITGIRVLGLLLPVVCAGGIELLGAGDVSASRPRAAARSPVGAVQAIVRGYYDSRYNMSTCSDHMPRHRLPPYATCPMTSRLRRVLIRPPYRVPGGLPFSRAQSAPRTVRLRQVSNNGHRAYVNAWWDFGVRSFATTFVVQHLGGGWLVADEYCVGRPSTSVFRGQQPCR